MSQAEPTPPRKPREYRCMVKGCRQHGQWVPIETASDLRHYLTEHYQPDPNQPQPHGTKPKET